MDSQLVHETISGWIKSCISKDQIAVAHEAVIKLYDQPYKADGTPLSKQLHHQCFVRAQEIEGLSEVFVPAIKAPSITSMKVVSDVGAMCDEINIDPMGYVEPSPSDNCTH